MAATGLPLSSRRPRAQTRSATLPPLRREHMRLAVTFSLLFLLACGGSKAVRKPAWAAGASGVYDDDGKWYYGIEKATGANKLERRRAADKKARDNVAAACKDVKPE